MLLMVMAVLAPGRTGRQMSFLCHAYLRRTLSPHSVLSVYVVLLREQLSQT